jgi:hypothetical protein
MQKICTDIIIDAPAEKVWGILTDFESFDNWNPFIRVKKGKLETGAQLEVLLQLPGHKPITMKPIMVKVEPVREFRWSGSMWVKGLFDGEHAFRIEELDESRSRLIQCERFKGVLVPLILHMIGDEIKQGFESMNRALKNENEKA